jgi:hypothetical protein
MQPTSESAYTNWLTLEDERARTLERSRSFAEYSHFCLIRNPQLQPTPPEDPIELRSFEIMRRSFFAQIALKSGSLPSWASDGLTSAQLDQLTALIIDLGGDQDYFASYGAEGNEWRQIGKTGPQIQRKLTKQVQKVREALAKLQDLAGKSPPLLGKRYTRGAECCLHDLDMYCTPISDETLREQLPLHPREDDPISFAVVPLYWFYKHECGLTSNESQVRAAMIRNAFLTPPGEQPLAYSPGKGGDSSGCPAVRAALKKYRG